MRINVNQINNKLTSRLSKLSISVKLTIALLSCAVFTPVALIAYTAVIEEKTLLERQRIKIQHRLDTESNLIKNRLNTASRDVIFLSQVPAVRIFSSTNFSNSRKAIETKMLDQFSKISSSEVFVDFMKTSPLFRQLTYLDQDGIERLRIDQTQGEITLIDDQELQDQSQLSYFIETLSLSEGEVFISDIENYVVNETGENTLNPVIHLATQVFDKRGRFQGVLVIHVSGEILQNLIKDTTDPNDLVFLIDSEGNYLSHPDSNKSWSKLTGKRHSLQHDYRELKEVVTGLSHNELSHFITTGKEFFFIPVTTDFNQYGQWYIVELVPSTLFLNSSRFYLIIVLIISISGILFSLILGFTFSKFWLLNPIKELTKMTKKISRGEFETVSIKRRQDDEIGELCQSFNQMSSDLSKAEQERKQHVDNLNREISERKKVEEDLLLHRTFFEQSTDAMFIADDKTRITYVNPAFSEITGYTSEEAVGNKTHLLHSDKHENDFYQKIWQKVNLKGYWQGEIWERRKGKENFPALQTINTIKNANGDTYYVTIFKDISKLKEKENELWKLAHFDPLTNLPNRKLLEERIKSALSEAHRHQRVGSLIFLDLDNFKHINDSLGHNHGDLVLKEIATRLKTVMRSEDTVARLGGDEYVILLPDLADSAEEATNLSTNVTQKLFNALQEPCSIKGYELHVTTSVGIVIFPSDGDTPQKLLKQADAAMYTAKNEGKNTFSFYHSNMQEMADKRLRLERELRHALKSNELAVYYQPQYNQHFELIGYEALIRWIHPERGIISPIDFIPIAEESDLILEIGDKVLHDVCNQLASAEKTGHPIPQISVNISPRQFSSLNFIDWLNSILNKTGVNPNKLMLEVTEGIIVRNMERTISNMQILKKLGIRFSIDDFGTGYSSLSYLKQLPIDELKIDRSFVCDIGNTQNDAVIVDTIVSMARHLNLELIAEGVETKKQLDYLINCGCNGFQGYFFSPPIPGEQILSKSSSHAI